MENKIFANIIKSQRTISGYNQTQAAKLLLLTRSSYQHYESGRRMPSLETVIRMGALYKIHPVDLIGALVPKEIKEALPNYLDILYCGKYAFSSEEIHIISLYNELADEEKRIISVLLKSLAKKK